MGTDTLLSVKQVAFILKLHPLTIRRYIHEKKLKAVKVGGSIRINESDLQDFQKDVTPPSPTNKIFKTTKISAKQFSSDDPFFRLQGRGASLKFSK